MCNVYTIYLINYFLTFNKFKYVTYTFVFQAYKKLNIVHVGVAMLATHAFGMLILSTGPMFTKLSTMSTENSLYLGFMIVSLLTVVIPPVISRL